MGFSTTKQPLLGTPIYGTPHLEAFNMFQPSAGAGDRSEFQNGNLKGGTCQLEVAGV